MINALLYHGSGVFHEAKTHRFLHDFLYYFPHSTLLDAGAWLGDTSIQLAEKHRNSTILAIEPNKENCEFIQQQNIKQNKNKNLRLYNCGLSDTDKKFLSTDYNNIRPDKIYKESTIGIQTKTVDYFYEKYPELNLIHLDVETYEYMCIQGCKKIIEYKKPLFIIELLKKNKDKDKIRNFFQSHHYTEYFIPESVIPLIPHFLTYIGIESPGHNHVFVPATNVYTNFIDMCLNKKLIQPVKQIQTVNQYDATIGLIPTL
jgi:FkbM family methyltransferase